jgi:hypothetical protein
MSRAAQRYGFEFSREEVSYMSLPSGMKSVGAYTWMLRYFACVGDDEPNAAEIHLDPIEEKSVWKVRTYFTTCYFIVKKFLN